MGENSFPSSGVVNSLVGASGTGRFGESSSGLAFAMSSQHYIGGIFATGLAIMRFLSSYCFVSVVHLDSLRVIIVSNILLLCCGN